MIESIASIWRRITISWQELTTPSSAAVSERQRLHSELLLLLILLAIVLGIPLGLLPVVLGGYVEVGESATWVILALIMPVGIVGYYLNHKGHVTVASWVIILGAILSLFIGTLFEAPITGTLTMYYLVVPLYLSGIFLSASQIILMTLLCMLLYLSYPLFGVEISYTAIINGPLRLLMLSGAFIALYTKFRDTLELRRQRTMARREAQQRLLLETAFDGIVLHENWIIRDISEGGAAMLGYSTSELLGFNFLNILDDASCQQLAQTGSDTRTLELKSWHRDGRTLNLEFVNREEQLDGQLIALAAFRDITFQVERQRNNEIIQVFSAALNVVDNRNKLVPIILENLILLLPVESAALYVLNEDGELRLALMSGLAHPSPLITRLEDTILGTVLRDELLICNQAATDYLSPVVGEPDNVLSLPIMHDEQKLGVLWLSRQALFSKTDETLVLLLVASVATALDRSSRHAATRDYAFALEKRVQERTQALVEANEQLKALDKLKSKFISDMSHELRTPVTNLSLYLELLEHGRPDKHEIYLQRLNLQTTRLRQLLEDILNLSRLEMSNNKPEMGPVNLNDLLSDSLKAHQPKAEAAELTLEFVPTDGLLPVWGERNQLVQVIDNLVANSLNYTDEGQVILSTVPLNDEGYLGLRISDTGKGIVEADLPHVKERFYRGQSTDQSNIPGTGLGLAIVAEIVDLHKGKIEIESQAGQGTTITIWLQPVIETMSELAGG